MSDILTVTDYDNRDPDTTILTLSNGTKVEVSPIYIFHNMIGNLPIRDKDDTFDPENTTLQDEIDYLTGLKGVMS